MSQSHHEQFRQRDAGTLKVLGSFFALLAVLVLLGSFWDTFGSPGQIVNLAAGLALLLIGVAMVLAGRRLGRGAPPGADS